MFYKNFCLETIDVGLTEICSDDIWQQRSESTLAQLMAHCLMAPRHLLKRMLTNFERSLVAFTRGQFHNGPNGHLFYVGGDLVMRRGMLPIIMLPDGDLRIALHLVPFWIFTIWGSVHIARNAPNMCPWYVFENYQCKITAVSPTPRCQRVKIHLDLIKFLIVLNEFLLKFSKVIWVECSTENKYYMHYFR